MSVSDVGIAAIAGCGYEDLFIKEPPNQWAIGGALGGLFGREDGEAGEGL